MSDTVAMILCCLRRSKIEDYVYAILCITVFAGWGVLLALGV